MKKGVIFDMDGVLVDNANAHIEAFQVFCKRYGIDLPLDTFSKMFGMTNEDIIPALLPSDIVKAKGLQVLSDEKEAIYREQYAKTIKPVPGLIEFVHDLKKHGVKLAVGSSGCAANVDFVIKSLGLEDCFDAVVNGDMITRGKPDPEVFLLAAKLLGLPATECVVIEDSFAGIDAARAAGAAVIALATSNPIESLRDYDLAAHDFQSFSYATVAGL